MPSHFSLITIIFPNPINVSVQVGDTAYYTDNVTPLGTHNHSNYNNIIQANPVDAIHKIQHAHAS